MKAAKKNKTKQKSVSIKKWAKDLSTHFYKDTQMANTHAKGAEPH